VNYPFKEAKYDLASFGSPDPEWELFFNGKDLITEYPTKMPQI